MSGPSLRIRIAWWVTQGGVLAGTLAASAWVARPQEWHSTGLLVLLFSVAAVGEWFTVETTHGQLSASLATMILAMGLLGPSASAAVGIVAMISACAIGRKKPLVWLDNLVSCSAAPFAGAWVVRGLGDQFLTPPKSSVEHTVVLMVIVFAGVCVLLVVNFVLFAVGQHMRQGRALRPMVRELFLPMLLGEMIPGLLAIVLLPLYQSIGIGVLLIAVVILMVFRQLNVLLARSEKRAEKLEERTMQLANMQFAVLALLMDALGERDPGALRHAAAVASYSKELAIARGCEPEDQEIIHLTGLLHDIGKVGWPDRLLHSKRLSDADWDTIRSHPQVGFNMVGKIDGFGAVAEAILHHHERVDGGGYPAELIGSEIPLASRIVAVASTYDTMTMGETMPQLSPEDAMAELARLAGTQLDGELVKAFLALLHERGSTFGRDADYMTELAQDKRVARLAEPQTQSSGTAGSTERSVASDAQAVG